MTLGQEGEERLRLGAYHDALTGLPNRLLFEDHLSLALAGARRRQERVALLLVDLDALRHVNDGLGHKAGDEVLKGAAERLRRSVRAADTVARLGGDEFVLVLNGLRATADAARVGAKINAAAREPMLVAGREIVVTASVGISVFPDDGTDEETLLRSADTALYGVKDHGRDGWQLFDATMQEAAVERLELEGGLRRALERGELVLHYQPILQLDGGRLRGFEALLRWRHPTRGLIAPGELVPAIEAGRLTMPIGQWALREACAQARAWQAPAGSALSVAVNIGARHFQQHGLVEHVAEALGASGLDPGCLVLEITEHHAVQNAGAVSRTLGRLQELGVRIWIDDFGTGHSSLGDLRRLPLHCLKIDRSFVADIGTGQGGDAIARAIIGLAHTLGLEVVAEGVETQAQARLLAAEGCDLVQGFLYGPPRPAAEYTPLLAAGGPWPAAARPARGIAATLARAIAGRSRASRARP